MKLRMKDGMVVSIMPPPRRKRERKNDEFVQALERWIYLTKDERGEVIKRLTGHRFRSWKWEAMIWAMANRGLPTLPCEGVTLISETRDEEDARRAYWEGWSDNSERVWKLRREWPTLTGAERLEALSLAELMAADFPLACDLRDWMKANLDA